MAEQKFTNRRVTGLAGLGTVILFGVGNALWAFDQPDGGASAREVMAFYASDSSSIVVGASLSLVSVALFVLFASGAREINASRFSFSFAFRSPRIRARGSCQRA